MDVDPKTGSVDLMVALAPQPPTVVNGDYERAARAFIEEHKGALKLTDPRAQLALEEVGAARDGTAHVKFSQREGRVAVDGVTISVHFKKNGAVAMLTGPASPEAGKANAAPSVTEDAALAAAEAHLGASLPSYDRSKLASAPAPKLVLVPDGAGARLAWKLRLEGRAGATFSLDYYVDAQTGLVMKRHQRIASAGVSEGSGEGVLGDKKSFVIREMPGPGGRYAMFQGKVWGTKKGRDRIVTHAWVGEDAPEEIVRSDDPDAWDEVSVGKGAAVDAHRYTADTTAWFRKNVGWASYDGRASELKVIVHDNRVLFADDDGNEYTNHENAFWDGEGGMHYGDGSVHAGGTVQPTSCALDIVGHEFMHGVTQHTSGLVYEGQPGALNEALSDIFGIFVEHAYDPPGAALFSIGEAAFPGGIRDIANPGAFQQPAHMDDLYTGDEDNGGVHINSGIVNNAFYLMTWGGANPTSGIEIAEPIGVALSQRLWWQTARKLLRSDSDFDRAARVQVAWAKTQKIPLEAVACAWVATGVLESDYVSSNYGVNCTCDDADGGADAGSCAPAGPTETPDPEPEGEEPELFDSCKGRADGVYCSELASFGAIVCEDGLIASGQQCEDMARCIGPDGPGARIACEGRDPAPPPPPDDTAPMGPDSCAGKADGLYCSSLASYSAYECRDETIAGGAQCAEGETCAGPNGPGALVCR